ncbi:MAG: hypothetical protein RJA49_3119 [Actinomycetota bacterium]|jgi:hypothetical protein
MKDVLVGCFAILVGALFCFRGWLAMRIVIPIWGAFAGFLFGAGLIQAWFGDGFLRTPLSWLVGLVLAMVFFFLAYLYYEVCVILAMGFIGFTLAVGVLTAVGVTWNWVLVLVGLAVGIALGVLAIRTNLPMGVLVVFSALAGATIITGGVMLIANRVNVDDFAHGSTTKDVLHGHPVWFILYAALVVAGVIAQIAFAGKVHEAMLDAWTDAGGKHIRSSHA